MFQSTTRKTVSIIFDKSENSGIKNAEIIKQFFPEQFAVSFSDPLEHPVVKDINIHLEVPIYSYVPWALYNIFIMNPENYNKEAWEPYIKHFDLILTKEDLENSSNLIESINNIPVKKSIKTLPPILERNDCPSISVVTLIYNRRKFFDLARHNMILTDYPKNKIQWVIVDDSDIIEEQASDKIIQTQNTFTDMDIKYVPLLKKTPVSQKRNIGVENCDNNIILFMDDDDHYPETSFRRRVAWLTKHPLLKPKAVCSTTIACYDLVTGISAVNCPPFDIPLGQRISEATLTFYKDWFISQKFEKNIQVGEGESLIKDRESDILEIPPQQIIVAFSHGKNTSSRRIPASDGVEPSCFWGFPKEYLQFIHGLVGIKVV